MDLTFRMAGESDLPAIVRMLADDPLGQEREKVSIPLHRDYVNAFHEIATDPHNCLIVAVRRGDVVASLQLTIIPGLTYVGALTVSLDLIQTCS